MMNFREIFNMNYSYIGLVFIGLLIGLLFLLDKNIGIKVIGYSFLIAGICLGIMYFLGNMIVSSFSYSFFIEIISDNFFDSVMIFSVISIIFGGIGVGVHRYVIN